MDLGLLAGLGEGLQAGLQSYRTERDYQDYKQKQLQDQLQKRQSMQADLYSKNMTTDDAGNVVPTELGQQEKQLQGAQTSDTLANLDKNSEQSRNAATAAGTAVNRMFPGGKAPKEAVPAGQDQPAVTLPTLKINDPDGNLTDEERKGLLSETSDYNQAGPVRPVIPGTPAVPAQPGTRMGDILFPPGGVSGADVQRMQKEGFLAEAMKAAAAQKLLQSRMDQSNTNSQRAADAGVQKAIIGSSTRQQMLDERKNQNAAQAGKEFEHDPIIKLAKTNLNSLTRSESILNNSNKPLTPQDLNLAYNDYINAVTAGGAATEGKIHRELPETWATDFEKAKQKVGQNDDIRNNASIAPLIDDLRKNITQVRSDMQGAVSDQAKNVFDNFETNTNPKVQEERKIKLGTYSPQHYKEYYGTEYTGNSSKGMLPTSSQPTPKHMDSQALEWAKANPNDPRSAQILKVNGVQ